MTRYIPNRLSMCKDHRLFWAPYFGIVHLYLGSFYIPDWKAEIDSSVPRENEVIEHIPLPYDNLFQSIFVFAPRCEKYI